MYAFSLCYTLYLCVSYLWRKFFRKFIYELVKVFFDEKQNYAAQAQAAPAATCLHQQQLTIVNQQHAQVPTILIASQRSTQKCEGVLTSLNPASGQLVVTNEPELFLRLG